MKTLFKAKERYSNEWLQGLPAYPHITDTEKGVETYYFYENKEGAIFQRIVSAETLCQYIDRTDINGNMIFENDIVRNGSRIFIVHYYAPFAMYMLKAIKSGGGSNGMNIQFRECEVIGNIFDNPELLQKEGEE